MPTSLTYIILSTRGCHLGDLMRLWVRPEVRINLVLGFSRARRERTGHPKSWMLCQSVSPYRLDKPIPGTHGTVKKKRELFPGLAPSLRGHLCCRTISTSWFRNFNLFPFRVEDMPEDIALSITELTQLLGSTHPCPTAVHMEPFPTSVFKVHI